MLVDQPLVGATGVDIEPCATFAFERGKIVAQGYRRGPDPVGILLLGNVIDMKAPLAAHRVLWAGGFLGDDHSEYISLTDPAFIGLVKPRIDKITTLTREKWALLITVLAHG